MPRFFSGFDPRKLTFAARSLVRLLGFLAAGRRLHFERGLSAQSTIIVVLCDRAHLSFAGLSALAASLPPECRVILVDNGSGRPTRWLLARIKGARIVRNATNRGFGPAVNQALGLTDTPFAVLLNNDALVRPGSIAALLRTLQSSPAIGAVGARVVQLTGEIQEAGCILWADGHCSGYGRGWPADAAEVLFRREVDFCSGVFLALRLSAVVPLGGLDPDYAPAYYEDVDLCVRLRQNGFRILYEPEAVVDHYEFGTSASTEQAFALQRRNHAVFVQKHRGHLRHQPSQLLPPLLARQHFTPHARRILVLDDQLPDRTLGAGLPRLIAVLQGLIRLRHAVSFLPLHRPARPAEALASDLPHEVEFIDRAPLARNHRDCHIETDMILAWLLTTRRGYYDTIWVSRPNNLALLEPIRALYPDLFAGIQLIYDSEAIAALRAMRRERLFDAVSLTPPAPFSLQAELDLAARADRVVAVSEGEARIFRTHGLQRVHVLGHSLAIASEETPFEQRPHFLFVGPLEAGRPNADGLHWFVASVLPRLRRLLGPGFRVQVAGVAPLALRAHLSRHAPEFEFLGPVRNLAPVYAQARVFIAPIRFASGVPLKVHEAAAFGVPVVTSSLLAGLLDWPVDEALLAADEPATFAARCAALYTDPVLWSRLRRSARLRVEREAHPENFLHRLDALLAPVTPTPLPPAQVDVRPKTAQPAAA